MRPRSIFFSNWFMPKPARLKDRVRKSPEKAPGGLANKILPLSLARIEKRKARETGVGNIITPTTPVSESDMAPHMKRHLDAVDAISQQLDDRMTYLAREFQGAKLYALTEEAVARSLNRVAETITRTAATQQLVNVMMRNLEGHQVFANKLVQIRLAAASNDIGTLVDELLNFAKFFDTDLWSGLNVLTETVWEKTGFAVGNFTRDFHLHWMQLLNDPFISSVMGAVAEAAKSLAAYKETSAEFVTKRRGIEDTIASTQVLEQIRQEVIQLSQQHIQAIRECERLSEILRANQRDPASGVSITEAEIHAARALANKLDYLVQQATTRYYVAAGATATADENADAAKLPGHAIQLHVRAVADLFLESGMFVLHTAAFFAAKKLIRVTEEAKQLTSKGAKAANSHQVGDDLSRLSKLK